MKEPFCECDDELVPGALFPWADRYNSGVACVERCDCCQQFADDMLAAEAVARKLGPDYTAVDDTDKLACVIHYKGKPMTYSTGRKILKRHRVKARKGRN